MYANQFLEYTWTLFPKDVTYIERIIYNYDSIFIKCLLILGHSSLLNKIISGNSWLKTHNIMGNRALIKYLVMIEIYGETRNGRKQTYIKSIREIIMTLGTSFSSER